MKTPSWYVPRRTLLQTAGTAVALPVLEAMIKPGARAAAPPPVRFMVINGLVYGYVGRPDDTQNTMIAPWSPAASGPSVPIENNSYLKPFFDRKIQSKITLLTGLTERVLWGSHDSPVKLVANTYPLCLYNGMNALLTATPGPTTVGPPPQPDPFNGATADQIAARHLGQLTALPYLSLKIGGSNGFAMSNKSSKDPIPADTNPKTVFDRLFGSYDPKESLADVQRRARYRKSVLDGVKRDASLLMGRLGRSDAQKLAGYLDSVRDLEQQIDRTGSMPPPGFIAPAPYYANGELLQKALQKLIVQAFATDRTRVIAFAGPSPGDFLKLRGPGQSSLDYSQYRLFTGKPLVGDHHDRSHYEAGLDGSAPSAETTAMKKEWMNVYAHWALEMYADLLGELDRQMDVDGISTVLDNTVCAWGGDDADSAQHACASMPCVLGGRGGSTAGGWRIRSGRHIRFGRCMPDDQILVAYTRGQPFARWPGERGWKDLLWGMLNMVGVTDPSDKNVPLKSFGYATNPLDRDLT